MKKILMNLAILSTPLSAAEMPEEQSRALMVIAEYINSPPAIPFLDSRLSDDENIAQDFWTQHHELKHLLEATDNSFRLIEHQLATYEEMNNTGKEWVGQTSYHLFASIQHSINDMNNLITFLKINDININKQMARTNTKIIRYKAIAEANNNKTSPTSSIIGEGAEEKLERLKNTLSCNYHQHNLIKRTEQSTTRLIIAVVKKDLGLPLTEDEKNTCTIM